ncbi:MAG: DUF3306 domain-containing protein [Pseudomonadota bacterium]|nr:DUF3306 domain-containing protein [Pseudomonadota bacterium]
MSAPRGGFLSRWSQRKLSRPESPTPAEAKSEPAQRPPVPDAGSDRSEHADVAAAAPGGGASVSPTAVTDSGRPATAAALPTLDDVAALTHRSDYSRFVLPGVEPAVSNAAMRKLFSDPHFNVMDGLDTYIDDYGKADPIPLAMLRQMNQSVALGLFADEPAAAAAGAAGDGALAELPLPSAQTSPDGDGPCAVAQSASDAPPAAAPGPSFKSPDDDPDLRLQQDDAARPGGARKGPRA